MGCNMLLLALLYIAVYPQGRSGVSVIMNTLILSSID